MPADLAVKSYRDLQVWQKAMALVVESHSVARLLPKSESYGLIGQIQRAAVSVPANIAEGHGREHLGDYVRHLSVANGSLMELETHFLIAVELRYVTHEQTAAAMSMTSEVGRMRTGLTRRLRGPLTPET